MKTTKCLLSVAASLALFCNLVKGSNIDGSVDVGKYPTSGQPLAVQTLGSNGSASNPTNSYDNIAVSSGSQLDAAYGVVSNGTLYLLLTGNMQSDDGDPSKNDILSIFIDTQLGVAGGQNTLSNNNEQIDIPAALPRMSFNGVSFNHTATT